MWRSATWPRIISWLVSRPATALAKNTMPMSAGVTPASVSAPPVASCASARTLVSGNLPKRVMAAPAT